MSAVIRTAWMVVEPRKRRPEEQLRDNWASWRMVSIWLTRQEAVQNCGEGQRVRKREQRVTCR